VSVILLKTDEIGDFVMATGALRILGQAHSEDKITLVVKSELASLARREFPRASIIELPWQARKKGRNQAADNIYHCFPAWRRLCAARADDCICLRSKRNFLQSLFFVSPRVARRLAPENLLVGKGGFRRRLLERLMHSWPSHVLVPYPHSRGVLPMELESHRQILSLALGREIPVREILPRLSAQWRGGNDWILCPFSSRQSKDYHVEQWTSALELAVARHKPRSIRVAGGPGQGEALETFAASLRAKLTSCPVSVEPPRSLEDFAEFIAVAGLVLTVDTSAAHMACAVGTPAVIVDSGLHFGVYGPYSPNGRQLWLIGDRVSRGPKGWRETISPSDVDAAIAQALNPLSGT
jgi:ADP-heptose:LPS heptosyltransferase